MLIKALDNRFYVKVMQLEKGLFLYNLYAKLSARLTTLLYPAVTMFFCQPIRTDLTVLITLSCVTKQRIY